MDIKGIYNLLKPKVQELGYSLCSLKRKKQNGQLILEVVIDRPSPINMDDIVKVSQALSDFLDETDPILEAYTLDVSSLGAEKPLDVNHLDDYKGQFVHIELDNRDFIEGDLIALSKTSVTLSHQNKTRLEVVTILKDSIESIRLAIKF